MMCMDRSRIRSKNYLTCRYVFMLTATLLKAMFNKHEAVT